MKNGTPTIKPRIVILGAGFGGLACALRIARKCGEDCDVTLLDKRTEHLYTPLLYEVASGYLGDAPKGCVGELRSGICINFEEYTTIIGMKAIHFKHAEVKSVDKIAQKVSLGNGTEIAYDYLVIALGSEAEDFGVPGVREHAFKLKTIDDALMIRTRLRKFIDRHLDGDQELVHVVICGGGASGVEVAAELAMFFESLRQAELIRHRHAKITLIDSGPTLLSMCDMTIQRWAEERLRALGVDIMIETKVLAVHAGSVDTDKGTIEANVVLWTAGIKPSTVSRVTPFAHDERGKLLVEQTFLVQGEKNVFAIGDNMLFIHSETKKPVAPLAQSAMKEGDQVADNILRMIDGIALRPAKLPTTWPSVIALGGKYAVATIGGFHVRGFLAYVMRKVADLDYFYRILPLHYALHVFWRGSRVYIKND